MPYLTIKDYRFGMDRRRERVAGVPGTLWLGKNVHITRGGDVERRQPFVAEYDVAGSFGLASLRSQLYTFGSADLAAGMPLDVQYQRLVAPDDAAMVSVLDVKTFAGKFYVIAEYDDGNCYHFYDGVRVADWDVIGAANASFDTVAKVLANKIRADSAVGADNFSGLLTIKALTPGVAFTISKSTVNSSSGTDDQDIVLTEVQANVAPVEEVPATATVEITGGSQGVNNVIQSILVNASTELLSVPVGWSGSNAATAIRLASEISKGFTSHGFSADAAGQVVTVRAAPGTGDSVNGQEFFVTTHGDVETTFPSTVSGGVDKVDAIAQIYTAKLTGTFEAKDTFALTINGTVYQTTGLASGTGRSLFVDKNRVWSPAGSLWQYCMLNRADVWDPNRSPAVADNDAGFINISSQTEGNEDIVVAVRYQGLAAVLTTENVILYQLDQAPANFALSDVLENTGTDAAKAAVRYGNNDVFYRDVTGIRSLRARDASNAPFVSDIGNAIDTFVNEFLGSLPRAQVINAIAAIEPRDGRYWFVAGSRVFVLSFFPGAKISAWTFYDLDELDGALITAMVRRRSQFYARAGDFIWAYGGNDGKTYPDDNEIVAEVDHPFVSGETPATIKTLTGVDIACSNVWEMVVAFDPNDDQKTINVGRIDGTTFADPNKIPLPGETSMVAPKLTCSRGGPATLSMLAIHYNPGDAG